MSSQAVLSACFDYLSERVLNSLPLKAKNDKAVKQMTDDTNRAVLEEFVREPEQHTVYFYVEGSDKIVCSSKPEMKKKGVFLLKSHTINDALTLDQCRSSVTVCECSENILQNLNLVAHEVFFPLLANPNNRSSWSGPTAKEVMMKVSTFLSTVTITVGQSKGQTLLPHPPPEAFDDEALSEKERIHVLESAVIAWANKIEAVLNSDPDQVLRAQAAAAMEAEKAKIAAMKDAANADDSTAGEKKEEEAKTEKTNESDSAVKSEDSEDNGFFPGPQFELEFWSSKQSDLLSLSQQLASPKLLQVHSTLSQYNSPFADQLSKLSADVNLCYSECVNNNRFLKPLKPYFNTITEELDFTRLESIFHPLFHTLMLVFQHSNTYNNANRLQCLVQQLANSLITQANKHVNGESVFRLIEDENTSEAVALLKQTTRACEKLKLVFAHYQAKAAKQFNDPASANYQSWNINTQQVFLRLDAYLERAADMMDLCRIVLEFSKLQKIYLGGTKGRELTLSLWTIHTDFLSIVDKLKHVSYDLLDINSSTFDDDFYYYRCSVKDLERRLAAIIAISFDESATLTGKFQLLDSFEGLIERPIIKDELDKKITALLSYYLNDLKAVQEIFYKYKNHPRIESNLPPIAGALTWVRSLVSRIEEPMEKLKYFAALFNKDNSTGEREDMKEILMLYTALVNQLTEYESGALALWSAEIDVTSEAKLQQNLLRREDSGLLKVNFDAALIKLLREVKYFLLLKLSVPQSALVIYEKAELYRQQIGNLELIVSMYNEMISTLHAVEKPLVERELNSIDAKLENGLSALNWKDNEVNAFINESMLIVQHTYNTVKIMKENLGNIKKSMIDFAAVPLIERKNKPLSPADFEDNLRKLWQSRHSLLVENGELINKLLEETKKSIDSDISGSVWSAYVDFVQDQVRDGLALTIVNSLKFLCDQLDTSKPDLTPMLEIKLALYANELSFNAEESQSSSAHSRRGSQSAIDAAAITSDGPESDESSLISSLKSRVKARDIWELLEDWVEHFFDIGSLIQRQDGTNYVKDLKRNADVVKFLALLKKHLESSSKQCDDIRNDFIKYEFLYKDDRQTVFNKFLSSALAEQKAMQAEEDKTSKGGSSSSDKADGRPGTANDSSSGEDDSGESEADPSMSDILPLDAFESQILRFKDIAAEIGDKRTLSEIGWLKLNAGPVKIALQSWANRWITAFTSYLYHDVTKKLNHLESLMNEVNNGLTAEVVAGDSVTLKRVLGYIHSVRSQEKSTTKMFQPLRDTVSLLKKYGKNLDEFELRLLSDAPMKWDTTVNNVYKVKEKVNNLQNVEVDKIKERVEQFETELQAFRRDYKENAPFTFDIAVNEAYDLIYEYHESLNNLEERAAKLTDLEKVFELSLSKHRQIRECRTENKLLKHVWDMCAIVKHQCEDWKKTRWDLIDTDELLAETKKLQKLLVTLPSEVQSWDVYQGLTSEIKNLLTVLPLVNLLHSPAMEDRHWRELKIATGKSFNKDESFCLSNVLDLELHKFVADVEYIVELANKESKISQQLKKIESQWLTLELQFGVAPNGIACIKRPDEILITLEEHMAALQGMAGQGKYVEHFIHSVNKWQKLLNHAETVVYDWLDVQAKWSALEAIFLGSKDIRIQLPDDSARFDVIDADWKSLMANAVSTPNVIEACATQNRSEKLQSMKTGLELCEKSLFQYLETKRKAFPRFYFLSNAALLDILSSGHDPQAVQKHLGDCFDNINKLSFNIDSQGNPTKVATGMYSKEGDEYVPFNEDFHCVGPVEEWLSRLVVAMQTTLREILSKAKFTADHWEIEKPRQKWLFDYPAQLALTASQIIWTEEVGSQFDAFADGNEQAMKEYASKVLAARLEQLIQLVLGELTHCDRVKIMTLITVDVHNRDVVAKLIDQKIQDASAFAWQSQMRMKWVPQSKDCLVQVADASFNYFLEYVGNTGRLVITPLTDRCYITLTQALRLIMGGAPAGPAGTGKTETTKDLGRAMAIPVYVFNCSEQMNVQSMGTIFKGLAQTGAWGCFDEFNRIPIEVLSVVSTQVGCILNGVREKRSEFDFMGELISLIPSVGMFITMNPGYAGRTELPENLKALFRSCAMCVPDMTLICENMLMSEGFLQAQRLAKKFTTLYSLSSELLSKQKHYDWGLRATKAVLRIAGALKRAEPKVDEDRILMRALRDSNLAKLVDDDKPIFRELVNDLFPGLGGTERKVDPKLQEAIVTVAQQRGLQAEETFVFKCLELAELLAIRHSVFVIGAAGTGKSEIWKTLYGAYKLLGKKSIFEVINPKAIRNNELYGWLSKTDWHDGVLSTVMRNMSRNRPPYTEDQVNKWVVLDGDIDPNWIETMNCFPADDHELLTASGFMTLEQVQDHFTRHSTLDVACYVADRLEYHPITADKLTIATGQHELIDMKSQGHAHSSKKGIGKTNGIDISPTRNHRMFGVCRPTHQISSGQRNWANEALQPVRFATHSAGKIYAAGRKDDSVVFQFKACARAGLLEDEDNWQTLPFVEPLGLQSLDEVSAFVELYGYWLGGGWLDAANRAICCAAVDSVNVTNLDALFERLPSLPLLAGGSGPRKGYVGGGAGYYRNANSNGQRAYIITHRAWWDYFAQQYGHKYKGYWCRVASLEGALRRGSGVPRSRYAEQPALAPEQVEPELRKLLLAGPSYMAGAAEDKIEEEVEVEDYDIEAVDDEEVVDEVIAEDDEVVVEDEKWSRLNAPAEWKNIPFEHQQPEQDVELPLVDDSEDEDEEVSKPAQALVTNYLISSSSSSDSVSPPTMVERCATSYLPYEVGKISSHNIDNVISTIKSASLSEPSPPDADEVDSAKWAAYWARRRLGKQLARQFITGLKFADGHQKPRKQRLRGSTYIGTSSARFKEELVQILLHAGYSVSTSVQVETGTQRGVNRQGVPVIARRNHYGVHYSRHADARSALPRIVAKHETRARLWSGTVWCVSVPTPGQRIVFRKVTRRENGVVVQASRPVIVGNTVMDDNKMLTLVSNERIPLSPSMRMMFEISNLDNATPATVSRAGILFINQKDIGSKPFLDSWIERRDNDKEKSSLLALFNKYCTPEYLHEMMTAFARIVPVSEITIIRTLCYLLEGLLAKLHEQKKARAKSDEKLDPAVEKEQFEANFVFAVIWAFGGAALVDKAIDTRKDFSDFFKRVFTTIKFPKEGHVFDYYPDPKTGKIIPWSEIVPEFYAPEDAYLVSKVFVPTVDTVSLSYVVDLLVQRAKPVLLVGSGGTGKTVLVNHFIHNLPENMLYANINLNYYTDAKSLQAQMEGHVDKRSGRIYGPPTSKRLVYFIDDLNMPAVDAYGTQSPSCLVKQHMDYGAWYDTTKLEKKEIQDVQYICAMNPTAGSFTVDPRLQGLFATFACLLPSKKNLTYIYNTVLTHHFKAFPANVQELVPKLIKSTIELHDSMSLKFIPSTKKFHYLFNLRDLSNVFQGLCLANASEGYNPKMTVQLWYHECQRVFSDRLVSPEDCAIFTEILDNKLKSEFKEVGEIKANASEELIFASFAGAGSGYMPADNMAALKTSLEAKLAAYNEENPIMNLELFILAIQHICRIARIIENPRGNALLVGVGGSGKQSLAKLASFICGYDVFQISVSQSYGLSDLKADLQGMYIKAGVKNLPLTWLLTDTQIVDDTWLVYVNDLLSSGNIADLFNPEDKDGIINQVRNEARSRGVADTREALYEFFINQVRTNLHVVLCFSPVGELFRIRCRKFPGLISCTTIDWFHPWPRDALVSVANRFLAELEIVNTNPELIKAAVAEHMAEVHLSVNVASTSYAANERRYNYTTPKSFLELISFYKGLLGKKRAELKKGQSRLEKGIATLKATHAQVANLKEDLQATLLKVKEKSDNAAVLISKMGVERKKVEEQQAIANVEAEKARSVSEVASKISAECAKDLDAALPILEKAKAAVECLSKASLTTLKSFAAPPGNVLYVTNAVLTLKQIPGKKDWPNAKKMMKDVGKFLDELKSFDATNIDPDVISKLQPTLDEEWFNEDSMKSSSEAAANLCGWVVNTVAYNKVYKNVAPKMAAQAKANEELSDAQAKLKVVEDRVAAMQAKLSSVTESLKSATDEKNRVEAEAANCQQRLELANRLVDGLAGENTRWSKSILEFEEKGRTLVGDTMLAASFVSYIGAFNQKYRQGLWKDQWLPDLINRQIPLTEGVDPLAVLATDSDFAKWKNEGLAADRISLENGAIITQCSRWSLMIDPQLQGQKWIKGRVKNLKIVQLSQKRWMQTILQAVQMGESVLIEGVGEELDATLDPVLSRAIFQRGSQKMIKLGAEEVAYDDNFHLYIQTKLFNPHYRPEIFAQCTLINFIVTEEGLEEQLLALVVNKEKPELEEKRTALVRAINDYMVSLTELENELLERLSNAPDDILSDVALIEGLEKTKQASTEIEQKVELAKKQEISINAARNEFRMVAAESSWLYFLLIQLCSIDHMYQYSLDAFIGFFLKAMDKAKKAEQTKGRVVNLRESIRIVVFTWVNRGLFEKHKLIFSSQLCFKLMQKGALSEVFDPVYYDYLIRGPKKLGSEKTIQLDWLPVNAWAGIQKLIDLPGFEKLASDMQASPNRFKEWFNKPRPEDTPLPLEWRKLDDSNPFMKLLVLRAMRPDRMTVAMENYVRHSLPSGKDFTECDAGKSFYDVLTLSLDDATPVNPIFFILSAGADPVHSVELIAKRTGYYESRFHRVALGEGQDVVAMHRLEAGHKEGHWVVLENIHLMPRWNSELEKKLDEFAAVGSHPDFRVFLSAEPNEAIPIGILERSIKLTNEPPQGLKQNLKRAFASFEKDEFEFKDPKIKSILFGLCHFHSVMIERIKFGPKGWNKAYPFSTGDLMCSNQVLANYLESGSAGDKVPWSDLRYIFGEILYGGHITDDWDRLLCSTYLEFYMREELLDEMEMYPFNENYPEERFRSPPVLPYDQYFEYIDHEMRPENPVAFGLHPNAEIAVKTRQCTELFTAILDLQPRTSGGGTGDPSTSPQAVVSMLIQTILSDKTKGIEGINFNLEDIATALVDERGPYQNVFLQECDRMNMLCREMRRSLKELDLGLSGELQMSEKMEVLFQSLYLGRVPVTWSKLAYPSQRSLASWMDNLVLRAAQLQAWTEDPTTIPIVTQISYLFNPQSFLTAIMQKTAQKNKMELDKLVIATDVTRKTVEQTDTRARDGAYVYGLFMEGARWNWNAGIMEECLPREMSCALPVVVCRAVLADKLEKNGVYRCPCYKTQRRGDTFVFTANLRTKAPAAKWVLAGAVLVMEVDE